MCFNLKLQGKIAGQIYLPMPQGIENLYDIDQLTSEKIDLAFKNNIEDIVTRWTSQMNEFFDQDSSQIFNEGNQPLPNSGNFILSKIKKHHQQL